MPNNYPAPTARPIPLATITTLQESYNYAYAGFDAATQRGWATAARLYENAILHMAEGFDVTVENTKAILRAADAAAGAVNAPPSSSKIGGRFWAGLGMLAVSAGLFVWSRRA